MHRIRINNLIVFLKAKKQLKDCRTALHCTVLYSTVLYSTVLYCTVLCCTVLHCTVLYCTVLHCTVLYCTVLYCTELYCTELYCTALYCTVLYCTVLYCTVLYCTVLYCTVLYCTVLYCTAMRWHAFSLVSPPYLTSSHIPSIVTSSNTIPYIFTSPHLTSPHLTSPHLTSTLSFRSPTIVVGDNRGAVTVYRVLDPITVTHEGPQQQMAKLKQVRTSPF